MPRIERWSPLSAGVIILPVLLIAAPAHCAAEVRADVPRRKLSAVSLLPDGSKLHGVMFPRYDENQRLVGVLKAQAMTLVNSETIAGETVEIEFFNKDQSPRGRVDLVRAVFNQTKGLLEAREPVVMQSDRINARGTGLSYAFQQGRGFLIGPATTWIHHPTATTMNSRPSPTRTTALVGMSLLTTLPLAAAPPPAVSPGELATIHADATSGVAAAGQAAQAASADLARDLGDAKVATTAARGFISEAGIAVPDAGPPADAAAAKPLEVTPGPDDTVITCDGGMYFDADAGVVVYLKNVRVSDPRFALTGANQLQIFLGKKPAPPAADPADPADPVQKPAADGGNLLGGGLGVKFGNVERIVASGAVRILQKQPEAGKAPIEASGAIFTYHTQTGQIILSGGYPWVKQGSTFMRAEQPNLNLRILKSGSFVTEGKWVMGGTLPKNP